MSLYRLDSFSPYHYYLQRDISNNIRIMGLLEDDKNNTKQNNILEILGIVKTPVNFQET